MKLLPRQLVNGDNTLLTLLSKTSAHISIAMPKYNVLTICNDLDLGLVGDLST